MKTKITIPALLLAAVITITGCATKLATPTVTPANPATGAPAVTNYYVPNTAVTTGVGYVQSAAPLIPAPWGTAATALATIVALVAGYVAQQKNSQANASAGAAASLAAAVVAHPEAAALSATATKIAAANGSTAATATALASANSPT
jgi:hypothetical protein